MMRDQTREDGVLVEGLASELERRSCQPPRLHGAHQRQASPSLVSDHVTQTTENYVNVVHAEPETMCNIQCL
jgi:hypothetical protein